MDGKLFKDKYFLMFLGIFALAVILRLIYLNTNAAIWWDAGDYLTLAKHWGVGYDPGGITWYFRRAFLLPAIWAIIYKLGGHEVALRISELLFSVGTVAMTYFLGKEMFNKKIGLIAAFGMAVSWVHLFFTARLLSNVPATFFLITAIYFFWRGYVKKDKNYYMWLFAVFMGLAMFTRFQYFMFFIPLLIFVFINEKGKVFTNKKLWLSLLIIFLVLTPFFINYAINSTQNPIVDFAGHYFGIGPKEATSSFGGGGFIGVVNYFKEIPTILKWPFFILFILGLITFYDLFLGLDLLFKKGDIKLNKKEFMLIWILINIIGMGYITAYVEHRYLISSLPFIFFIVGLGLDPILNYVKKYKKEVVAFVAIIILIIAAQPQLSYANSLIEAKKDSYVQIKDAAVWINEHSSQNQGILTASGPQTSYYSERPTYPYPSKEEEVDKLISEGKVSFIMLSRIEPHPDWAYDYPQRHNNTLKPVQAYFLDPEQQQLILVIYEVISS